MVMVEQCSTQCLVACSLSLHCGVEQSKHPPEARPAAGRLHAAADSNAARAPRYTQQAHTWSRSSSLVMVEKSSTRCPVACSLTSMRSSTSSLPQVGASCSPTPTQPSSCG